MTVVVKYPPPTDRQLNLLRDGRYLCDWGDCEEVATWFRSTAKHGYLAVCNPCALKPDIEEEIPDA